MASKEYYKEYYIKNKERIIERVKKYAGNNKEKVSKYQKSYSTEHKNELKIYKSEYFKRNYKYTKRKCIICNKSFLVKDRGGKAKTCSIKCSKIFKQTYERNRMRIWEKNRKLINPQFRLKSNIATSIWQAIKSNKNNRHWEDLVGYTLEQLTQRLSLNFTNGMTWNNYGKWHIDYKKPQSLFNYEQPEEQAFKDCWSLANLQPLWAYDNIIKSNKF